MDINYIKSYLRVDYDDDDILIETLYNSCIAYLEPILNLNYSKKMYSNFIEYLESKDDARLNLVNVYILAMMKELYDNRGLVSAEKTQEKAKYTMAHILNSLQYWDDKNE